MCDTLLFLYIDPLKQGLKHVDSQKLRIATIVFIHRSIKTRIETCPPNDTNHQTLLFLYIDPLKQGLKLLSHSVDKINHPSFYT